MSFFPALCFQTAFSCLLEQINQRSMGLIVEQSALFQSAIDWLTGWAICQFSLAVPILSPPFVSQLPLLLTRISADSK